MTCCKKNGTSENVRNTINWNEASYTPSTSVIYDISAVAEKMRKSNIQIKLFSLNPGVFRNEFDFWNVHGIMNNSGLLQSK